MQIHASHPALETPVAVEARAPADLLAAVEQVREIVMAGANDAEAGGTLPEATVAALRASGLLAMKVPAVLGGGEADILAQMAAIEALAAIDAAAAWCVMVGATAIGWPAAFLPDAAVAQMFRNGIPTAAVAVQPTGRATRVAGGYRLRGRWSFTSGINHAEWIVAGVLAEYRPSAQVGMMLVFPKDSVAIIKDWEAVGLQGTGSHGFAVEDLFVPESFAWHFPHGRPRRGGAMYRLGWPGFVIHEPAAFALGIARHALDVLMGLERGRMNHVPSAGRDANQSRIGLSELRVRAARALVWDVFTRAWATVCAGDVPPPQMQSEMRAAAAFATDVAIDVATLAFRQGGSRVVYRSGVLQRCLRDIHAAAQHWLVRDTALGIYGQFLLGVPGVDPIADAK
jgi:indole-3-acetate monooxygenase